MDFVPCSLGQRLSYIKASAAFSFYILYPLCKSLATTCFRYQNLTSRYSDSIKTNFANIDKYKLRWLYVLVIGLGAFISFDLGITLMMSLTAWDLSWLQGPYLLAIESAYVFLIGIFAAKQPQIIFAQPLIEKPRKYDRSSLNHQKAEILIENINQLMTSEKLYLDNEVSLE